MGETATPTQRPQARLPPSDRAAECLAASDLQLAASDLQPSPAGSPISHRDDAVGRLEGALAEQDRQRQRFEAEAAFETSDERNAYAGLREANERVATRARWLALLERNAYGRLCEASERERVATRARWLEWIDQHWDRGRSTAPSEETR
jgi:hypothetical protein